MLKNVETVVDCRYIQVYNIFCIQIGHEISPRDRIEYPKRQKAQATFFICISEFPEGFMKNVLPNFRVEQCWINPNYYRLDEMAWKSLKSRFTSSIITKLQTHLKFKPPPKFENPEL